ncbi:MAG: MoxR family ATPase [Candidatus Heimdallarchaeum endolithica]|uniref:MoxR family ATPase n=1 Tax=Candidatus Heimdallarchaeum endolithica TaxID=2876572 RepID=A0A9Y1BPT8_9ARCH|nr:MAG: MoxR family ATPase [Candidatus Heimdallarchaeum endolithica]
MSEEEKPAKKPAKGKAQTEAVVTPKDIKRVWSEIYAELKRVIIGKLDVLEDLFIALLARGHVLLEGVPGVAKTVMAKNFAATLGAEFKRGQFTPDLLPSDVVGTTIYDPKAGTFKMRKGPIFTNIFLADEINRSPPKTQAALLEAMAEKQVTVEGTTFKLEPPFLVIATQNPVEQEGTYPLPEAQVDRFMFKLIVDLPSPEEEIEIIDLSHKHAFRTVRRITTPMTIIRMIETVEKRIYVHEDIMSYIRDITVATRTDPRLLLGGSPRCSIALLNASKAVAAMNGRDYVIPDDVKRVAKIGAAHRLQMKPEAELEGTTGNMVMDDILRNLPVPV